MDNPYTIPPKANPGLGVLLGLVIVAFPFIVALLLPLPFSAEDEGMPNEILWQRDGSVNLEQRCISTLHKQPLECSNYSCQSKDKERVRNQSPTLEQQQVSTSRLLGTYL